MLYRQRVTLSSYLPRFLAWQLVMFLPDGDCFCNGPNCYPAAMLELSGNDLPSQSGLFKPVVFCITICIVILLQYPLTLKLKCTLIIHPASHEAPLHRYFCTLSLTPDSLS